MAGGVQVRVLWAANGQVSASGMRALNSSPSELCRYRISARRSLKAARQLCVYGDNSKRGATPALLSKSRSKRLRREILAGIDASLAEPASLLLSRLTLDLLAALRQPRHGRRRRWNGRGGRGARRGGRQRILCLRTVRYSKYYQFAWLATWNTAGLVIGLREKASVSSGASRLRLVPAGSRAVLFNISATAGR